MSFETSKCKKCEARVVWAITLSGKKMPLDAMPDGDQGDMTLYRDGSREVRVCKATTKPEHKDWTQLPGRYLSHFATCSGAEEFRKRPGANVVEDTPEQQMGFGCTRCKEVAQEYLVIGTTRGSEILCRKCSNDASPFLDMLFRDAAARARSKKNRRDEPREQSDEEMPI